MARHRKVIVPQSNDTKDEVATIKDVKLSSSKRLNLFLYVSLILIAGVCLLILLPNPIDPIAIEFENYECKGFASNEDLEKSVRLFEGELIGPEGFAVDGDGNMYTGLNDGRIIKFNDTSFTTVIRLGSPPYDNCGALSEESRCGRALGLEINPKEPYLLYIADCYHGISTLDLKTGERVTLVNSSSLPPNIPPMKFVNDMVVLDNGSIFFTDSSSKFSRDMLLMEVYEGRPNGKLVHYNPVDRSLSVVLPKLHFANGLSQSPNDEFLLIVETTRARILRYYLKGSKVGQLDIFIDKLPGMPDNISPSSSGGYWVGFAITRESGISDFLGRYPLLRTIIVKLGLSHALVHMVPKNGMIMELDQKGKIVCEFYDMGGDSIIGVSEVLDMGGDTLYLGSYETPYIGKFKLT